MSTDLPLCAADIAAAISGNLREPAPEPIDDRADLYGVMVERPTDWGPPTPEVATWENALHAVAAAVSALVRFPGGEDVAVRLAKQAEALGLQPVAHGAQQRDVAALRVKLREGRQVEADRLGLAIDDPAISAWSEDSLAGIQAHGAALDLLQILTGGQ